MFPKRTRLKTFDYVGEYRYFLTFCTADRRNVFTSAAIVELVLAQFWRAAHETGFEIVAYCFMPDHVHLLIEAVASNAEMKQFAKLAKQYAGFYYRQRTGRPLWQPSYWDHVLRDEEDTWSVTRYIVENRLPAGLAKRADEYPFLGSCVVDRNALLFAVSCAKPWERR
jgi:REP-associated tyrosine transposase